MLEKPIYMKRKLPAPAEKPGASHMPRNSLFYEKVVPALLILMAIGALSLIVFAACVLLGLIRF